MTQFHKNHAAAVYKDIAALILKRKTYLLSFLSGVAADTYFVITASYASVRIYCYRQYTANTSYIFLSRHTQ